MKAPRDPIELQEARQAVRTALGSNPRSWDGVCAKIRLWKNQLKVWEDQEQLKEAFAEGRLTIRTMSHGRYKDEDGEQKKLEGIINAGPYAYETSKGAERDQPGGIWKAAAAGTTNVRIDASGAGLNQRLNPQNFLRNGANGRSQKNALGLHTLSASLLNPDFPMTLKYYSGSTLVALMPLPLPQDIRLFYELRQLSKSGDCTVEFIGEVVILRK